MSYTSSNFKNNFLFVWKENRKQFKTFEDYEDFRGIEGIETVSGSFKRKT